MPEETAQRVRLAELPSTEFIFGSTVGMRVIREKIERAAQDDLPVLIEGESGTGKEVVGRFLHENSIRRDGPFLKLNCAAASASLLEGEIFGYEKVAGNDRENKIGSIGLSSEGTLFLDDVDDVDMSLQRKIAMAVESGRYRRMESMEYSVVSTRFVCAASINSEAGLRSHTLFDELPEHFVHHRVRLLPLRERREDIPHLCEYLLEKLAGDFGRPVPKLSSHAVEAFQQWKWPGNIRELENWIARIVLFGAEEVLGLEFRRRLPPEEDFHRVAHMRVGRSRRIRRHR